MFDGELGFILLRRILLKSSGSLCINVSYIVPILTRTEARAALIAAGYKVPRGTHIEIEEISNALYTMPLDFFMANAVKVDETQEATKSYQDRTLKSKTRALY